MKTLILNADDLGADDRTNGAILRTHRDGVLTSASLMVNGDASQAAVEIARENPQLGVGLHLVMSDGRSALPATDIPALVDSSGRFPRDPAAAGIRAFFLPSARRQVAREVEAQFARFAVTGLPFSHVDGHQHLHLHPVIWDSLIACCSRYGVPWVRVPYEEFVPATRNRLAARRVEWIFFRVLRNRCLRSLRRAGLQTADRVYGHLETGHMSEGYVLGLLPRIGDGITEIYFHPGTPHAAALRAVTEPAAATDVEMQALLSPRVRQEIERCVLRLSNYAHCLQQPAPAGNVVRVE